MSLTGIKKSPLISLPFLKKRLRRITGLGLRNLTVNEFNFTVHFTLHRNDKTVAFYTSESVENQRSPEWSYLQFPTNVQFLQDFLIRVWITSLNNCRLLLEYDVHLDDSLIPDEQKDDSYGINNSLWLEMFGYRFTDNESIVNNQKTIQLLNANKTLNNRKSKRIYFVKSYNKLSILRMINVIDAIRDENRSSKQYLERSQTVFDENKDYLSKIKEREIRHVRIENLRQHLLTRTSMYERRLSINQRKQEIINERKNRLEINLLQLLNQQKELNSLINHLNQSKCLLHDLLQLTNFRQKEIISEIYRHVYLIIRENKNEYSIADIKLPPAEDKIYQISLPREREYEIETAVGYCAHIVFIISQFIQLPLRFPIEYYGASSVKIHDYNVSTTEFPLYPISDPNSFEYGLFLLNRNIGQIMHHCRVGGRHTDYRKTLENLKELMEQYFLNTNHNNSIQLYGINQQSVESTILFNNSGSNINNTERVIMRNKRNSTANSIFSPSRSETSSAIEIINDEDDNHDVDLFPTLNTISPRLTMQFSQQQ